MQSDFTRRMPGVLRSGLVGSARSILDRLHIDWLLLLILCLILGIGSVVLYSASDTDMDYLNRQMIYVGMGVLVMLFVVQIPLAVMRRWAWLAYLVGLVLLVVVLVAGADAKGAQRWIDISIISFQPSEIIKLSLPLMLAAYLGDRAMPPRFKHVFAALALVFIPVVLVLLQPDLGTAILVSASGLVVLLLAGLRWRYILSALALLPVSAYGAWLFVLHDYQKQRVLTMFNPEADKLGAGWNIIQSTTAIGSGGWSGKGWMLGTQSHLDFLPESHTDFIIAVLAEEFGFRGVLLLLALYLLFFIRGFWISFTAQNSFSRLLAGSITFMIFVYVFVNMAMVSGILPVVGVPLPLVSYGGTSLVTMFAAFGVLMAVATERESLHAK